LGNCPTDDLSGHGAAACYCFGVRYDAQNNVEQGGPTMMSAFSRRLIGGVGATLLLVALSAPAMAQAKKYQSLTVRAPDGVTISAQDWGNPSGPEILFIHGFSQASLSWQRQVESDLAKEFRVVTYDLRGHGNSDKPFEPEKYKESKAWADEVQAIIDAARLRRPVLVGWSYGGRVIADYLRIHGPARLAGLNMSARCRRAIRASSATGSRCSR
jgi:non-heme chloroperoxidase